MGALRLIDEESSVQFKGNLQRSVILIGVLIASLSLTTACSSKDSGADKVLQVAYGSGGSDAQKTWDSIATAFTAENPGWKVEFQVQNDDLYETIGLKNLLTSGNPPDVYFEWAGARLNNKNNDGFAADITDLVKSTGLADQFGDGAFNATSIDGKIRMVPYTADVTNVIWYNKDIFAKLGITPPTTWSEMLADCAKIKASGVTPFGIGNKDLWVAGNWFGHVDSRVAGDSVYDQILSKNKPLNSPEFVKALQYVADLHTAGYVNASANSISDNEGYTLFYQGKVAMLPIGSWIISSQIQDAPKLNMGWFNLPAIEGGAGDQKSIMAVTTGFIVNAKSKKQEKAVEFLKMAFSPTMVDAWIKSGTTPVAKASAAGSLDALSQSMIDLLNSGATVVAPPDTGYDLKMADALNTATSEVLDGVKTPQQALDDAEAKVSKS
ncbi:MAG: extracellular solute-binding protein [Actinobacteria bacterium]|nr:extracellular solute-binding protein [Actinomycetota bacterium]MSY54381.1 extracellular solute-binding protein [Actinomycetota bacterium]MSZ69502.1 extracellular solute-binding protein [Actinomycetota bacterium]